MLFILSAAHAISKDLWYVEMPVVTDTGLRGVLIPLKETWSIFASFSISGEKEDVDFGWSEIDLAEFKKQKSKDPILRSAEIKFEFYQGPLDRQLLEDDHFCFASKADVEAVRTDGPYHLIRDPVFEVLMKYDGFRPDGLVDFKLNGNHKGDDHYRGSSGSPILDPDGAVVSMVLGGDEDLGTIRGLPLFKYSHMVGKLKL